MSSPMDDTEKLYSLSLTAENRQSLKDNTDPSIQKIYNILSKLIHPTDWDGEGIISCNLKRDHARIIAQAVDNSLTLGYSIDSSLYWLLIEFASQF